MNPNDPQQQPDFLTEMRQDLSDWRQWLARAVVLVYAVTAGLAVVAFTWLSEHALAGFDLLRHWQPLAPLVWTPAWTAGMAWLTLRWFPGASGSGIPQVMSALNTGLAPEQRSRFVSLRLSAAKLLMTAGGLLGGLAIGREGPSVQIAAGIMHDARRWLPARSAINEHGLLVAGGAAGIAAAFNAPLAGVMFAIEELTNRIEQRSSGLVIGAIVLAGLMAVAVFGNASYFGVIRVSALDCGFLLPGLLVIVACGLLGGGFARLLHASIVGGRDRFSALRARHPVRFAAACGLAIALLGLASGGTTFGSGYDTTRSLVEGQSSTPLLYVTLRIVATWLAVWSGVPGGIFAPSLAIGAGLGHDIALLTHMTGSTPLIALGMAGFLAAVTQAPMTSFIIVMEMVDGHQMVLSLMAAALGASLISRWICVPLYGALSRAQLQKLQTHAP
ncbi:chloride channel protein [Paucibacter sp. R3-3]|uniref:Chloride channel protein n=1 Tax=Roseateles agri TaxID=3098619 RepID=A0ABU5D9U7_9BURK|nr:chloride channel protein [Paucibacter sp. R3-3]MDY0743061.1 chloride channel protein [Paucibacter sp. R3-3]